MTAERVAAAQALRAEPAAADHAVARDRFGHVIGAAGRVAAAAGEQRRQGHFINANERESEATHAYGWPALSEFSCCVAERERVEGRDLDSSATNSASRRSYGASRMSR